MYHNDVDPTLAHYFPVYLENNGKKVTVVTQNADGLHQKAGSTIVLDLHGNQYDFVCQTCGTHYTYDELTLDDDQIPRCPKDNGIIKSTAVLFGDPLDMDTLNEAVHSIAQSDLMIIAGTSLQVSPANQLVNYFNGQGMVIINQEDLSRFIRRNDNVLHFQTDLNDVLAEVVDELDLK